MAKSAKKKKEVPEFLQNIRTGTLKEFQETAGIDLFRFAYSFRMYEIAFTATRDNDIDWVNVRKSSIEADNAFPICPRETKMLYVEDDGTCWKANLAIAFNEKPEYDCSLGEETWSHHAKAERITITKWTLCDRLAEYDALLQGEEKVREILWHLNPYLVMHIDKEEWRDTDIGYYAMCPQFEILNKAGFAFADQFLKKSNTFDGYRKYYPSESEVAAFNRLCKPGKNPQEIFTVPPVVYKALKDTRSIKIWDELRKLGNKINNPGDIKRLAGMFVDSEDVKRVCNILKREYDGKSIFTLDTLLKYLDRISLYEAIDRNEGLDLLDDYLQACKKIDKKPVIDGDSLKREHDVTIRVAGIIQYDDETKQKIEAAGNELKKFAYKEANYCIRPIENIEDLVDESNQQGNCLAVVYPEYIAKKQRYVFVMRTTRDPDRSVATVELYDDFSLGQHLLSHNRKMTSDAQLQFIKRWLKHVEEVRRKPEVA